MNWALTFPALSVTHGTVSVLGLRRIASPRSNFLDMEKLTFQDYYSLKLQWH